MGNEPAPRPSLWFLNRTIGDSDGKRVESRHSVFRNSNFCRVGNFRLMHDIEEIGSLRCFMIRVNYVLSLDIGAIVFFFFLSPCDVRWNWFDILFNLIIPTSCVFFYAITYNIRELFTSLVEGKD